MKTTKHIFSLKKTKTFSFFSMNGRKVVHLDYSDTSIYTDPITSITTITVTSSLIC